MNYVNLVKLSEIAELITKGTTPTTIGYDFQDEGVNFLKVECFDEKGVYLADKVAHISDECNEKLKRSQLKVGDILFSIAGAIGRVGIVTEGMLPANTNQALAIIRIKNKDIYLPYIRLVLTSPVIKKQFEKKKQGVAQLNLSLKDLNELSIPLPNKDKQKVIVDLFNRANILINYINNELEYLDKLIRARFVEMFCNKGYPVLGWNDVFNTTTGKLDSNAMVENGDYPFFTCAKEVFRIDKYAFEQEALILAGNNAAGKYDVKYYKGKFNAYQRTYILSLKQDWSYRLFQYQLEDKLVYLQKQSLGGLTKYLTLKILGDLSFIIPPIDKQAYFEKFVEQVNKSKVEVQKALDKAQLLFDSLMQKYFG